MTIKEKMRVRKLLISLRSPNGNNRLEKWVKEFSEETNKKCGFKTLGNLSGTIDTVICVLLKHYFESTREK